MGRNIKKLLFASIAATALTFGAGQAEAIIIVDTFDDWLVNNDDRILVDSDETLNRQSQITDGQFVDSDLAVSQRTVSILNVTEPDAEGVRARSNSNSSTNNVLALASDPGTVAEWSLNYQLESATDVSTERSLELEVIDFDQVGSTDITVTLIDNLNNSFAVTKSFTAASVVFFLLSDFESEGVDLTIIKEVDIVIDGAENGDYVFDAIFFTPIPEPTTAGLLGLAALVMLRRRRRVLA